MWISCLWKSEKGGGGFGGCFNSESRQCLGGFYDFLHDSFIQYLELLARFHAMSVAWNQGWHIVNCQSNSLDAVMLHFVSDASHLYASLIWDIKELLR